MDMNDTICAVCTGVGGALGVIRLSGPEALGVGLKVWRGRGLDEPRRMVLGRIAVTGEPALAVYMKGPASYTGDDVVELQIHGGGAAARRTLAACVDAGARPAGPGEFTFRAFANGRMDLTQAEAVADVVAAESDRGLELATRQLSGALGTRIGAMRRELTDVLGELESQLDFSEEHLDWAAPDDLCRRVSAVIAAIKTLADTYEAGRRCRDGVAVVLAGRPNVGKSSLLNALVGRERSIVTPEAGTTRDVIEERAVLRNLPVRLIDTAGIRAAGSLAESLGVDRARAELKSADAVFWVLDAGAPEPDDGAELADVTCPVIAVWNKCDLPHGALPELSYDTVEISAEKHTGFDALLDRFENAVWRGAAPAVPEAAVNERHLALLGTASGLLDEALPEIAAERCELAAALVRPAIDALGEITGETAGTDVLDNIFSRFCIGK